MRTVLGRRFDGPFGWAQQAAVPDHPSAPLNVATWFMELPNPTIASNYFLLTVGSLERREGFPDPHLHYPQAEYELDVVSLRPTPTPDIADADSWSFLEPVNVAQQFHGLTREQAARLAFHAAWACTQGVLPAETQVAITGDDGKLKMMYVAECLDLWAAAVKTAVEHERTGGLHARVN